MLVTKYDVEQWLDTQVEAYKLAEIRLKINEERDTLRNIGVHDGIHMTGDALRFAAEKCALDLYVKSRGNDEIPYQISFFWRNTEFFAIETEKEYRERGAVV